MLMRFASSELIRFARCSSACLVAFSGAEKAASIRLRRQGATAALFDPSLFGLPFFVRLARTRAQNSSFVSL